MKSAKLWAVELEMVDIGLLSDVVSDIQKDAWNSAIDAAIERMRDDLSHHVISDRSISMLKKE